MKRLAILVLAILLTGCAPAPPTPRATMAEREAVRMSQAEEGLARVHLFAGEGLYGVKLKQPCIFYVNGVRIGAGNYDMFVAVDLEPGRYSFSWSTEQESSYVESIPTEIELRPNDRVYLVGTIADKTPSGGYLFGAIGTLVSAKFHYVLKQDPMNGLALVRQKQLAELNTSLKGVLR